MQHRIFVKESTILFEKITLHPFLPILAVKKLNNKRTPSLNCLCQKAVKIVSLSNSVRKKDLCNIADCCFA